MSKRLKAKKSLDNNRKRHNETEFYGPKTKKIKVFPESLVQNEWSTNIQGPSNNSISTWPSTKNVQKPKAAREHATRVPGQARQDATTVRPSSTNQENGSHQDHRNAKKVRRPKNQHNNFQVIEQLKQSIVQLEKQNLKLEQEADVHHCKIKSAQNQIADLERRLSKAEKEREDMTRQKDEMAHSVPVVEEQNEDLENHPNVSRLDVARLETAMVMSASVVRNVERSELSQCESTMRNQEVMIDVSGSDMSGIKDHLAQSQKKLQNDETIRRDVAQEVKGSIRVYGRVRPLLGGEFIGGDSNINIPSDKVIELTTHMTPNEDASMKKTGGIAEFHYDHIFPPTSKQEEVFEEVSHLIQNAMQGRSMCILSYGQTGSGKMYTMEGEEEEDSGIIPRAVQKIFAIIDDLKDKGWIYTVTVSFLEITGNVIHDLLTKATKHEILPVGQNKIVITNLTSAPMVDSREINKFLKIGARNRSTQKSGHCILKLDIAGRNRTTGVTTEAQVDFVQLCGSEILNQRDSRGRKMKEAHSLSHIRDVIISLSNKDSRVYYSDSKLAQVLQNTLTVDSVVLMIIHITQNLHSYAESLNSLTFGLEIKCQGSIVSRDVIESKLAEMRSEERRHALSSLSRTVAETTVKFIDKLDHDWQEHKLYSEALSSWSVESSHSENLLFIDLEFTAVDGGYRAVEINIVVIGHEDFKWTQDVHGDNPDADAISPRITNKLSVLLNPLVDFRSINTKLNSEKLKKMKVLDINAIHLLTNFLSHFPNICLLSHSDQDIKIILSEALSLRRQITNFQDARFVNTDHMFRSLHPSRQSFSLKSIYFDYFNCKPSKHHCAEFDAYSLLLCCVREKNFLEYIENYAGCANEVIPYMLKKRSVL